MGKAIWGLIIICATSGLAYWLFANSNKLERSPKMIGRTTVQTETTKPRQLAKIDGDAGGVVIASDGSLVAKRDTPQTGRSYAERTIVQNDDRSQAVRVAPDQPRQDRSPNISGEDPVFTLNDILEKFGGERALTRADIESINNIPARFAAMGDEAVPALIQFLKTNNDVKFEGNIAGTYGKYPTLRAAFIDALAQIGGDDAWEAMVEVMKKTSDPFEIRVLAKGLEDGSPDVYREEINQSAREVLNLALKGNVMEFPGLGHLLTVFKEYGDSSAADELEKAYSETRFSPWKQYAAITLADLPDGEGVPSLVSIATQEPGETDPSAYMVAARMLAQQAIQYPEARKALVDMFWSDKLDTRAVAYVAQSLGGNLLDLHLQPNGILIMQLNPQAPETWSDFEIDERLDLIDELMGKTRRRDVVDALSAAAKRLQDWRNIQMYQGIRRSG